MREWRPLHRGIITSDKLANVGDPAYRLFTYLIAAQDDAGRYPWSRTKRRVLTVGTTWSDTETVELGDELIAAGLCVANDGMIQIVNGAEMQGKHRADVKLFLYDQDETATGTSRARHVNDPGTLQDSREQNSRGQDTAPGASAPAWLARLDRHPGVTAAKADQEWIDEFEQDFSDVDLFENAKGFVDWWEESPKKLKRWKNAWRNWCQKAQRDALNGHSNDRVRQVRQGQERPKQTGDDRLAAY